MGGLLHLVQRGGDWAGPQPAEAPHRCTKCNSPRSNVLCTIHRIDVRCSAVGRCRSVSISWTTISRAPEATLLVARKRLTSQRSASHFGSPLLVNSEQEICWRRCQKLDTRHAYTHTVLMSRVQ